MSWARWLALLLLMPVAASAQSNPGFVQNQILTANQLNTAFSSKTDFPPNINLLNQVTGTLAVANGGTGATIFTLNTPLIGNGTNPVQQGTRTGTSVAFVTAAGTLTSGQCVQWDASGNAVASGVPCGSALPSIAANNLLGNPTTSPAVPVGMPLVDCAGGALALNYAFSTHLFTCNTITAGSAASITVGTTTVAPSNVNNNVLYHNASGDVLGELTNTALTAKINSFTTTVNGAVPNPGTASGKVLSDNATWIALTAGGNVTATTLTTNGVVVGTGTTAIGTTAVGTNGQLLLGQSAAAPTWNSMSQDCTINNTGVLTCTKTNNVAFTSAATTALGTTGTTIPTNSSGFTQSGVANFTSTFQISGNAMTFPAAAATLTQTIGSGTAVLGTSAIASGACATVVTVTTGAGNVLTTDTLTTSFNSDPTSTTGYQASANGMLTIIPYPTAGAANFKVCNNTSASITPGTLTLNWRVVR